MAWMVRVSSASLHASISRTAASVGRSTRHSRSASAAWALYLTQAATDLSSDETRAGLRDLVRKQRAIDLDQRSGPPAESWDTPDHPPRPGAAAPRATSSPKAIEEPIGFANRDQLKRLARAHPLDRIPCPFCNASVTGRNMLRHVDRLHVEQFS